MYNLFASDIYQKSNSIFKSKSMNFTIGTLVYSVAMIPGRLAISLECTDICA